MAEDRGAEMMDGVLEVLRQVPEEGESKTTFCLFFIASLGQQESKGKEQVPIGVDVGRGTLLRFPGAGVGFLRGLQRHVTVSRLGFHFGFPGPKWKNCPRCPNNSYASIALEKSDALLLAGRSFRDDWIIS